MFSFTLCAGIPLSHAPLTDTSYCCLLSFTCTCGGETTYMYMYLDAHIFNGVAQKRVPIVIKLMLNN